MAAWWATPVECRSVFARLGREAHPTITGLRRAIEAFEAVSRTWLEIVHSERVRELAIRTLSVHALRTADALQLAAALAWAGHSPRGRGFACLDRRLREAAYAEGFTVLPDALPAAG